MVLKVLLNLNNGQSSNMKCIVYKTTDTFSDKIYIGVDTKNDDLYFGSGNAIKEIIKERG